MSVNGRILIFLSLFFLVVSVIFSVKSFTGYIISEFVDESSNFISLGFFLLGISGTWGYFKYFSK